jgi:hypothetical protein
MIVPTARACPGHMESCRHARTLFRHPEVCARPPQDDGTWMELTGTCSSGPADAGDGRLETLVVALVMAPVGHVQPSRAAGDLHEMTMVLNYLEPTIRQTAACAASNVHRRNAGSITGSVAVEERFRPLIGSQSFPVPRQKQIHPGFVGRMPQYATIAGLRLCSSGRRIVHFELFQSRSMRMKIPEPMRKQQQTICSVHILGLAPAARSAWSSPMSPFPKPRRVPRDHPKPRMRQVTPVKIASTASLSV